MSRKRPKQASTSENPGSAESLLNGDVSTAGVATDCSSKADSAVERRLDLLTDQVDIIQVQMAEKKRPWFKTPATLLSIFATVLSVITFAYTQYNEKVEKRQRDIRDARRTMTETLEKISDIQSEFLRAQSLSDNAQKVALNIALNQKRTILSDSAMETKRRLEELGEQVSPLDLLCLAQEKWNDGSMGEAEKLLIEARSRASDPSYITCSLANLYMSRGHKLFRPDEARHLYEEELGRHKGEDQLSAFRRGEILLKWANAEFSAGFKPKATQRLEQSRAEFARLDVASPLRSQELLLVEQLKQTMENADYDPFKLPMLPFGYCEITFADEPGRVARGVYSPGQTSLSNNIVYTEYEGDKAMAYVNLVLNPSRVNKYFATWNRWDYSKDPLKPDQTFGTCELARKEADLTLSGRSFPMGRPEKQITIRFLGYSNQPATPVQPLVSPGNT